MTEAVTYLRDLQEALTEYVPPSTPRGYGYAKTRRQIQPEEWARVQELVKSERLVCRPHNAGMGFNFGVTIYQAPPFPGTDPEFLLGLEGAHFGLRFKDAYKTLSPLSHNPANEQLLQHLFHEKLEPEGHYDY